MSRKAKVALVLIPLGLVLLVSAWQGITYWWRHGYSVGERSGVVRKVSLKGSPVCKYLSGEMHLQGSLAGAPAEVWEFSVDDKNEDSPLVKELHEAARSGSRVTLKYRQDLPMWWTCNPIQYRITGVAK
jgi:hypothetical protein